MPHLPPTKAECAVQARFSKNVLFQTLALVGLIIGTNFALNSLPDREELGRRTSALLLQPAKWSPDDVAPLRLVGAWEMSSDDPRVGGISALAIDRGHFLAVTDSGAVIRFPRPTTNRVDAVVWELPDGPGDGGFKKNRDSEAIALDPLGRGWWVAFENRNLLWLYDRQLTRALGKVAFGERRWKENQGIEGLVSGRNEILSFPEAGHTVVSWSGGKARNLPLERPLGQISDAAVLPGGGLAVIHRHMTARGFANAITLLDPMPGGGFRTGRSFALRGSRLDNVEALAAERLASGVTRLWLMTDDNYQRPLRTLLVALDVPKEVLR
jgi:hypothetical protein